MTIKMQKIMGRMMCISVWAGEEKERDIFNDCFSLKGIKIVLHIFYSSKLHLCKVQYEFCLTAGGQGSETNQPTQGTICPQHLWLKPIPLLTDWIITPHSLLLPCMRITLHTPDLWAQPRELGLANGRWVVVMLVGSCVQCACSWLALLCSCDPLWEELVPQSHCPFSLSLRVNLHGTNLPEAWSPTWPSLHEPSQEHEKRDLFLYAIEILRYFITRQNLTNAPLLVRLWENYLSHQPG